MHSLIRRILRGNTSEEKILSHLLLLLPQNAEPATTGFPHNSHSLSLHSPEVQIESSQDPSLNQAAAHLQTSDEDSESEATTDTNRPMVNVDFEIDPDIDLNLESDLDFALSSFFDMELPPSYSAFVTHPHL